MKRIQWHCPFRSMGLFVIGLTFVFLYLYSKPEKGKSLDKICVMFCQLQN
jgi:hypothetical protein